MKTRCMRGLLSAALSFSLVWGAAPAAVASEEVVRTYDTEENAIVYTIREGAGERVTVPCGDVAASLLAGLSEPGQASRVAVRFVNHSENFYRFEDYSFTTVNRIDREVPVQTPGFPGDGLTVRSQPVREEGALSSRRGFDGCLIPYSMTVLRSVTGPLRAIYGVEDNADVTLLQVSHAEDALKARGYDSYADYLLSYYQTHCDDPSHFCRAAESLTDLHPSHQCEILGSNTFGYTGQSEIRQPRSLLLRELEADPLYDAFRVFGWGSQITGSGENRQVQQDYELLETDPEIIAMGYQYLYEHGLFLSFDGTGIRLPGTADQLDRSNLELWSYWNRRDSVQDQVKVLQSIRLAPGESVTLPRVTLEVQLPNSYDLRAMDFGFSLTFVAGEEDTPDSPGNSETPESSISSGGSEPSGGPDGSDSSDPSGGPGTPGGSVSAGGTPLPGGSGEPDGAGDSDGSGDSGGSGSPEDSASSPAADPPAPDASHPSEHPPQTGDSSQLPVWFAVLGAAMILLFLTLRKWKKEPRP